MEDVQIDLSMDVDAKINEAKVCHEMGLLDESLEVYQKVIPLIPEEDAHLLEKVKTQIGTLQKEIEERENTAPQSVSAEDLSIFKEALYIPENIPAITDSATAFKDMGLYNEAVLEYEKLLFLDHPYDKIIP
ncbi:MAG: type II/IV secretion system protein, partial [Deltaproteobacteria bacterium]|nr:type II/IV secretion system protein [Deltaproteobacteria bacterium]